MNESISSYLLPRLVGSGVAKELVFTGRVVKAKDAPAGLFNYVVPQEEVLDKGMLACRYVALSGLLWETLSLCVCFE